MPLRHFNAVIPTFAKKSTFEIIQVHWKFGSFHSGITIPVGTWLSSAYHINQEYIKKIINIIEAFPLMQLSREQVTSQHT